MIHAAQRRPVIEINFYLRHATYQWGLAPLVGLAVDWSQRHRIGTIVSINDIPFGAFIGLGELINCIPTEKMTNEQKLRSRGFGDFSAGRFAWELADVIRFKNPIPAKGRQGFFYGSVPGDYEVVA